jgi:hypothetical protein
MPPNVFTQDDQMFPVYCLACRVHIPRLVSNANQGYCAPCLIKHNQAVADAAAAKLAADAAAADAYRQKLFSANTGKGFCPRCSSPNLLDEDTSRVNSSRGNTQGVGCILCLLSILLICVGGLWLLPIGLIVLIVGFCLPAKTSGSRVRHCQNCGNQWAV